MCREELLGKIAYSYDQYHAYCPACKAYFSNSTIPEHRATIWEQLEQNVWPNDKTTMDRLKNRILPNAMNVANRKKKFFSMCNDNSEDALTWTVFNSLESYNLFSKIYNFLSSSTVADNCQIFYWGYNDKYPNSEMIDKYEEILQLAGEPIWKGGYSEPDILLFNPSHGLINIEVKYKSPNNDKLKERNPERHRRAEKMIELGSQYLLQADVTKWKWWELLRMWVPGCLLAERMNLRSFTLINLVPQILLEKESVTVDMQNCVRLDASHHFMQISWDEFVQRISKMDAITDTYFWQYIKRKFPTVKVT